MKTTANYGLKKPEGNDTVNIDDLNHNADVVDKKIKAVETDITDLKKHVSNGKDALYAAITGKKITPKSKDFDDLVKGIKDIKLGQGNAQVLQVLEGRTFTNDTGTMQTGTMKNRGSLLVDPTVNDKDYGQGYFSNVKMKGLNSQSESYVEQLIKEVSNTKGKGFTEKIVKDLIPTIQNKMPSILSSLNISTVQYYSTEIINIKRGEEKSIKLPFNPKMIYCVYRSDYLGQRALTYEYQCYDSDFHVEHFYYHTLKSRPVVCVNGSGNYGYNSGDIWCEKDILQFNKDNWLSDIKIYAIGW